MREQSSDECQATITALEQSLPVAAAALQLSSDLADFSGRSSLAVAWLTRFLLYPSCYLRSYPETGVPKRLYGNVFLYHYSRWHAYHLILLAARYGGVINGRGKNRGHTTDVNHRFPSVRHGVMFCSGCIVSRIMDSLLLFS